MKVKNLKLVTPLTIITLEGSDNEVTTEEVNEMLLTWDEFLNNYRYLKLIVGNKGYFFPEQVLKNSYVEVELCPEKQASQ